MSEPCIHEEDFGIIFERFKNMTESFDGLKTAVNGLLKYMYEKEAVEKDKKEEALSTRQRAAIYISAIIGVSGIVCTLVIKFF